MKERCIMCGTAVTPGQLIGNALENGAMPKMAEQALRAGKLYTDELGALRTRVCELEAMKEAMDRAAAENTAGGDPTELARRVIDDIRSQPYAIVYALAQQVVRDHAHNLLLTTAVARAIELLEAGERYHAADEVREMLGMPLPIAGYNRSTT